MIKAKSLGDMTRVEKKRNYRNIINRVWSNS